MAVVIKLLVWIWVVAFHPGVVTGLTGWKCRKAADAYSYWCFKLVTSKTNWNNANTQCKAQGGNLATIRDNSEATWVTSNMGMTANTWFGLNDISKEGTFRFSEDEKGEYVNFQPGEPNGGGGEDCAVMVKSWNGKWADVGCSGSYNYACSRPLGASGSCLSGWTRSGSECYMVTYTSRNFDSARTKCLDAGGDLARIYDSSQNTFLTGKIGSTHLMIGYNDKRQEGKWVWSVEDTMFTYWNPGEPNNSGNEDCAEFYGSGGSKGRWNDFPCTASRRVICKKYKDGNCPSGWHSNRHRCYYFHSTSTTWTLGRDICRNLGANYISIDDTTENSYLMGKVSATNYWIGGNDIVTEGTWTWKTDGGLSYTKWGSGQPDNSGNEDCGEFYKSGNTWYWNDNNCNSNNDYLCKRAIPYCGDPGSVSHASKSGSSYFQDDKVTYTCNSGYASGGSVTCQASSTWTTKPTCNKVTCSDPGNVQHATKSGTFNYGDKVTYTATSGYELKSGNSQRTCQANKAWSGTKPVFGKVGCQDPGVGPGAKRTGSSFILGDSLTYSCMTGWNVTSGVAKITCKADKSWSGAVLKCGRVSCGDPGKVLNATVQGSSFLYGDMLNFTCDNGFELKSGSKSRQCQADQSWTGTQPKCAKVQCPSPVTTGVQVSSGAKSTYEFRDMVTLSCMTGYTVSGGNATGHCMANSQWKDANLACSNIDDCSPNPCKNGAACADGVNSYTCTCTSQYTGTNCDQRVTTVNPLSALKGRGAMDRKPFMYVFVLLAAAAKMLM